MAKKKSSLYECQACGNQQIRFLGKCPECGAFNSYLELNQTQIEHLKTEIKTNNKAISICDVQIEKIDRFSTYDKELDLVLGGGLVVGSLVLLGGSPGVGKSTLLLKTAANLAKNGKKVLYVSAEESKSQIKLRANRLDANVIDLYLLTELCFEDIKNEVLSKDYEVLIIDSIQTIYSENISSCAGSITQVRELTFELMKLSKSKNISTFIIGHITKEGSIAGPRVLEHMVDVVLYFEGDASKELRILRGFKNRFGSTSEIGIWQMSESGLIPANNKFLNKNENQSGTATTIIMEGSRAIALEVQALVCESSYPKRSATGFDKNRLDMILALLERKLEIPLARYDVFINISGGIKVGETAADLAVAAAIISSFKNRIFKTKCVFIGELSLNGGICEVYNLDVRLNEAKNQGFTNAIIPNKTNYQGVKCFVANELAQVLEWM